MNLDKLKAVLGGKPGANDQTASMSTASVESLNLSPAQATAISAALEEAVTAAKAEGHKEGAAAAHERLAAVIGHEKIKGTGKEGAALALAVKSPQMSADDIADFVATHAGAPTTDAGDKTPTIEQRMHGQGADLSLGAPMKPAGGQAAEASSWDKAIAKLPGNATKK
jgi:hypothetical protein